MKSSFQAFKPFGWLLMMCLFLLRVAHAGEWQVTYEQSANYNNETTVIQGDHETGGLMAQPRKEINKFRISDRGMSATHKLEGGRTQNINDGLGNTEWSLVNLKWHGGSNFGDEPCNVAFHHGAVPGHADGKLNIHPVFHWKRTQHYDYQTRRYSDDPNDNPPEYLCYVEHATVSAEEFIQQNDGWGVDYNADHPFKGTQFTFDSVTNPLQGEGDTNGDTAGGALNFDGFYGYQAASYHSDKTKITIIRISGSEKVTGADRSFSGSVSLNTAYENNPHDNNPYDKQAQARIRFGYSVTVGSFNIYANTRQLFHVIDTAPDHREMDAWAKLNWKSSYQWSASPSPYVQQWLPEETTGYGRSLYTTEGSRVDKEFHFDLGDDATQLPKDSTVKVTIGKAEGIPETMSTPAVGPGSATIHWHWAYEGANGGGSGNEDTSKLSLLPGAMVTMAPFRDDSLTQQNPLPKPINQVQVGEKIVLAGHSVPRVVTGKETLPDGTIVLHLGIDPEDNPDDPAFDITERGNRLHDAVLEAQHTGATHVKQGLEAYKAAAEFYAYGPFYEMSGAVLIQGGSKAAELIRLAIEEERAAQEAGALASEARTFASEARQAAHEAQSAEEAAALTKQAEQAEKDASQLEAGTKDLAEEATHSRELAQNTQQGVEAVGGGDPVPEGGGNVEAGSPGSPQHKSQAWEDYEARGGTWEYQRWSNVYEINMVRAREANAAANSYGATLGWGRAQVSVFPNGNVRVLDWADEALQRGIEYKTGYISANQEIRWEVERDAVLVQQGWDIQWVFQGRASEPLLNLLRDSAIPYTFR